MNKTIYVIAGMIVLTMTGTAFAQNAEPRRGMSMMDKDQNGTVDKAEFDAALAARFAATDKNNDGITMEEYEAKATADRAEREARRAERQAENADRNAEKMAERMKKRFESMDANSDGKISSDEYKASTDKMFERMDRNGDGILNDRRGPGNRGQRS